MRPCSWRSIRFWARCTWAPATTRQGIAPIICSWEELFRRCALETAAFAEILNLFKNQGGLIADARIFVLARHVLERPIALGGGKEPMRFLPLGADQLGEWIARAQPHANPVGLRQYRNGASHILLVGDSHAPKIAESRLRCQPLRRGSAC